jgi:hypothetical protein
VFVAEVAVGVFLGGLSLLTLEAILSAIADSVGSDDEDES